MTQTTPSSSAFHDIAQAAAALVERARAACQRRALVLSGDAEWTLAAAGAALEAAGLDEALWISRRAPHGGRSLAAAQAHRALGDEVQALVFDAYSGFDLDAFGAASGAVRGGGLLLLLTPPLDAWPAYADPENARIAVAGYPPTAVGGRFFTHLVRVLRGDPDALLIEQGNPVPVVPGAAGAAPAPGGVGPCVSEDQWRAVQAIEKVVTGQRRRPAVLTSDRGRGKSAALGIAAARLASQGVSPILVTGPRLEAVASVFEHAHRLLPEAAASRAGVHLGEAAIEFVPPDELAHAPRMAGLVLVDEAAAIPTPLLERLLALYPRIAFATTVHGYEGTGRGFAVRFHRVLDERSRGWRPVRLETPIRWAVDDPVERLVFRALLLDAEAAPSAAVAAVGASQGTIERLDRDALLDDPAGLGELFGLLVLAHYRTRPYDLRHLLDGPNLSVWVACHGGHVLGTALVAAEGGFDPATARDIWAGRTRPHGHLLPESLAAHVGLVEAPLLRCARIMRIAVHPAAWGRGWGTRLVEAIVARATAEGMDFLGSSFAATPELMRFWRRTGFDPVRVSVTRGATSGSHSALVLRAISAAGQDLRAGARERYAALLPHQLADPLRGLDPALVEQLLLGGRAWPEFAHQDRLDLAAFAFGTRLYEVSMASVWNLACAALADPESSAALTVQERAVLIAKVLQRRRWGEVAALLDLPGRGAVLAALRGAVGKLISMRGWGDRLGSGPGACCGRV